MLIELNHPSKNLLDWMISSSLAVATKKDLEHDESTWQTRVTKASLYEMVLVLCPEGQKALVASKGLAFS
jgi:hypothetical protein